jgi:hypothetical protein
MRSFVLMFVLACGQPAQPAQPTPPAPEPAPAVTPDAAPPPVVTAKPTTCAAGRDDTPPGAATGASTICIGDIQSDGSVDVLALRASLLNNITAFKACYADVLSRARDLGGGMVTASLLLLRVGTAWDVHVDGFVPEVSDCIARELAHTQFPFLDGQRHVTFPITFAQRHD